MPSVQRGQVSKTPAGTWGVRYYDENGTRERQGGFATKSAAIEWLDAKLAEVEALRRGDATAVARAENVTLAELVDRYLAAHDADAATIAKLRAQLIPACERFGNRPIGTLRPDELDTWRKSLPANRHHLLRAVKQVLAQAERWGWLDRSPAPPHRQPKANAARSAAV